MEAWRGDAGLSKAELAATLGYTPQLIRQLEAGKNIPSKKFAEDADTYFTTKGLFLRLWKLINDTRHVAALPPGFLDFVAREAEASTMYVFEADVVKGIFQTPEYAYEVLKSGRTPEEIERLVTRRMERQQILSRFTPPRIVAVFDENVIRRMIGGREVMRGQINHLIELRSCRRPCRIRGSRSSRVRVTLRLDPGRGDVRRSGDTGGDCVEVAKTIPAIRQDIEAR